MLTGLYVQDLYQDHAPVVLALDGDGATISEFNVHNTYKLSSSEAAVLVLPNVSQAQGCHFLFVPGTCSGGVTIKDDAGNTVKAVATGDTALLVVSSGEAWALFYEYVAPE